MQVSSTVYGKNMDFVLDAGHDGTDHINNFNGGDCSVNSNVWDGTLTNPNDQNSKVFHADKIQYMLGQSTESFAYHETVSSKTWYDHYVIIPGEIIDPANKHGLAGMYFLGFDYEAAGQSDNQKVPRDYYFNDWIIKITPGLRKGYTNVVRIMCEDLGNSHDWDWNDVVFDVSFESSRSQEQSKYITEAIITVQCAGGTLPIYIGQTTKEVHSLWKKPSSEVIIHPSAPVIYRVDVTNMPGVVSNGTANARNIPVYVYSESATNTIQANKIPQKFACPNTVAWSEELVNICETYPEFPNWIKDDQSYKDVWKEVWRLDPEKNPNSGNVVVEEESNTSEPTEKEEGSGTSEPTEDSSTIIDGGSSVTLDSSVLSGITDNTIPASYFKNAADKITVTITRNGSGNIQESITYSGDYSGSMNQVIFVFTNEQNASSYGVGCVDAIKKYGLAFGQGFNQIASISITCE